MTPEDWKYYLAAQKLLDEENEKRVAQGLEPYGYEIVPDVPLLRLVK